MNWLTKKFHDLSLDELYEMLALRQQVFVVEQKSLYLDLDGKDQNAIHIIAHNPMLLGCVRVLPPGLMFEQAAIGRLVVDSKARKLGLGNQLMKKANGVIEQNWGKVGISISAQVHLTEFYEKHGFEPVGKTYVEDGIVHIKMKKPSLAACNH